MSSGVPALCTVYNLYIGVSLHRKDTTYNKNLFDISPLGKGRAALRYPDRIMRLSDSDEIWSSAGN
jgi:hypothetical protein